MKAACEQVDPVARRQPRAARWRPAAAIAPRWLGGSGTWEGGMAADENVHQSQSFFQTRLPDKLRLFFKARVAEPRAVLLCNLCSQRGAIHRPPCVSRISPAAAFRRRPHHAPRSVVLSSCISRRRSLVRQFPDLDPSVLAFVGFVGGC